MITLFQYPPSWGLPNASPFCMKLETYMRMANIPFESKYVRDPRRAPKGKFPFIKDGSTELADTSLIIDYLKQTYGDRLDAKLTAQQRAESLALQRLFEDHLYWTVLYSRWLDPAYYAVINTRYFSTLPFPLRYFVPRIIRKKLWRDIIGQGIGRHTRDEIYQMGIEDVSAITAFLADAPFLLGNEPTSIDAIGYAFVANIIEPPIPSPIQKYAREQHNLIEYCARMKARFYDVSVG